MQRCPEFLVNISGSRKEPDLSCTFGYTTDYISSRYFIFTKTFCDSLPDIVIIQQLMTIYISNIVEHLTIETIKTKFGKIIFLLGLTALLNGIIKSRCKIWNNQ